MPRFLRPLTQAVTYTRWLHLLIGSAIALIGAFITPGLAGPSTGDWIMIALQPIPLVVAAALLVPSLRRAEGLQARVMLFPGQHARVQGAEEDPGISEAPSASWRDRNRTALWAVLRLEAGCVAVFVTVQLLGIALALAGSVAEPGDASGLFVPLPDQNPLNALFVPIPLAVLLAVMVTGGRLMAGAARRLLGPSPVERLAALEERTEQLLERTRIARELHDSIGHALTVAVIQAGAARAAADPEFTDRALDAIEETGRAALEDLERVLRVLREDERPASQRPTLADAGRLLESARASGAKVDTEVTGPVESVPGPVSREGYRMLQESLTNVLRHSGPVPVSVRIAVGDGVLGMEVRNTLPQGTPPTGRGGSGLRGIRERATLLGGRATTGPHQGEWQVHVELPLG